MENILYRIECLNLILDSNFLISLPFVFTFYKSCFKLKLFFIGSIGVLTEMICILKFGVFLLAKKKASVSFDFCFFLLSSFEIIPLIETDSFVSRFERLAPVGVQH